PAALAAALGRAMPYWQRHLDAVVLTSPDARRIPGQVAALARYRAAVALAPPAASRAAAFAEWRRLLAEWRTPVRIAHPGTRLDIGGARLTVLAADGAGVLLRLEHGTTCAVLGHSAGPIAPAFAAGLRPCALLAFPWERDPRDPLIEALHPRHIVLTDGYRGDEPVELTYLERAVGGARLYHERIDGTVEWVSDGRRCWVVPSQS
ncbi:MAG TPA: hypothetical protein VNL77_15525, partial [Roseiflexaceae bacterium]|nr:hypothetical protein [Roseiflexaceae bacterium]